MPHASLSQTSHVCLSIKSVLASLDFLTHFKSEDWQVRVTAHAIAGLPLVPVPALTPTAPVQSFRKDLREEQNNVFPMVSNMTHVCQFDSMVHIPVRWRDLPRDALFK